MMTQHTKRLLIVLGCLMMIGLGYLLYLDFQPDLIHLLNHPTNQRQFLVTAIRSHGLKDAYLLILLIILLSAIPGLPVSLICIPVGICYGPYLGTLINTLGIVFGNLLVIGLLKKTEQHHPTKTNRVLTDIRRMHHPLLGSVLGYMVPIIPAFLVNLTVVRLNVTLTALMIAVCIGTLPTALLYSLGGDALLKGNYHQILVIGLILLALLLLIKLIKKERHIFDYLQYK